MTLLALSSMTLLLAWLEPRPYPQRWRQAHQAQRRTGDAGDTGRTDGVQTEGVVVTDTDDYAADRRFWENWFGAMAYIVLGLLTLAVGAVFLWIVWE